MPSGFGFRLVVLVFLLFCSGLGCGSTQQREASEQLLTSDAVDRSVAQMDFRRLAGNTVYFDTTYLKNFKGVGFVNAEYITSSLRQQLVAARCLLQDKKEEADFVVEARIGTLGMDRHEVTYGMPANNFLNAASSLVPNSPALPSLPELALAKRNEQLAAAKIGAFAYHRETGEPVWQSGIVPMQSTAKDVWILGAGPFQRGDIYGGTQFAGTKLDFSLSNSATNETRPLVDYYKPAQFAPLLSAGSENEMETPPNQGEEKPKPQPGTVTAPSPTKKDEPKDTAPKPNQNPIDSATQDESKLRLRLRFDPLRSEKTDPAPEPRSRLYRLDPEE